MRISDWSSDVCSSDLPYLPKCSYSLSKASGNLYWTQVMARQRRIEVREIGAEGALAVVVDDFAADPHRWRKEASDREYRAMGDFYPGGRAAVPAAYFSDVGPVDRKSVV